MWLVVDYGWLEFLCVLCSYFLEWLVDIGLLILSLFVEFIGLLMFL